MTENMTAESTADDMLRSTLVWNRANRPPTHPYSSRERTNGAGIADARMAIEAVGTSRAIWRAASAIAVRVTAAGSGTNTSLNARSIFADPNGSRQAAAKWSARVPIG